MQPADASSPQPTTGQSRLSPKLDVALRGLALVLVIGGLLIGLSHPAAIGLLALGWALLLADYGLKHWPRKPAH